MTNKQKYLKDDADLEELTIELAKYCTSIKFNGENFTSRKLKEFFNEEIQR